MPRTTGRSAFLSLLKDEGIAHLFGNPGTTELPVMHALMDHPELTYVMAMQESLVVAMADGFNRASGKSYASRRATAPHNASQPMLALANVRPAPRSGDPKSTIYANDRFAPTAVVPSTSASRTTPACVIHNADAGLLDRYVQSSKMVHAALLLLMLEAVSTDLVFTISLKRSTQNLQLSTSWAGRLPHLSDRNETFPR